VTVATAPGPAPDVLLVEDNPYDSELALRAFRRESPTLTVQVARDGAEALAVLLDETRPLPRLLVLDLNLPKMNGIEVLTRLRATPHTSKLPVVVLTSSREDRDIARAGASGADSYIVKPLEYAQFVEVVRNLIAAWLRP
jgi:two-component system response regulator